MVLTKGSTLDLAQIDAALSKAKAAGIKIILRFIYNHPQGGGTGEDAPLATILEDMRLLQPIVEKYCGIIYTMNAGFVGYWGEGHNSTFHNNTPDRIKQFLQSEIDLFGGYTMLQARYPSDIMAYEPEGQTVLGIHDDAYASSDNDEGTWTARPWSRPTHSPEELRSFGSERSDRLPFSGEIAAMYDPLQTCDSFDNYAKTYHLNAMNVGFNNEKLAALPCYRSLVNQIGPVISLTKVGMDALPARGRTSTIQFSFTNTGYSRLFVKVPVYFVLTDSDGNMVDPAIFAPVPLNIDLTQIESQGGAASVTATIQIPSLLNGSGTYNAALWMPDPDETLRTLPLYNYLLNNEGVPDQKTGLSRLNLPNF